MRCDVGPSDDFLEGVPRAVSADGRRIVIVRWKDHLYAVRDVCPHMGVELSGGSARPSLEVNAVTGQLEADENSPVIVCPWHGWQFRLASGRCALEGERARVKAYNVSTVGERVYVELGRSDRTNE